MATTSQTRSALGGIVSPHALPYPVYSAHFRTSSLCSERPSTAAASFTAPPSSVLPEAAFIADSAASQIVINDHEGHADSWYEKHGIEPSGATCMVSRAALLLVNNFLDQLLLTLLATARSTALKALRPAVFAVLKPKLAKDAVNQADEELREYLGTSEDENAALWPGVPSSPIDWDLELAWKRIRLRCMVYSSLGDMEEEDEDYYVDQEMVDLGTGLGHPSESVSPAVAIFLTSLLEFMGEQVLIVAGQAASCRMRTRLEQEQRERCGEAIEVDDRIVVEDMDVERVALDRTLGRLWRAWKKKKKMSSPSLGAGMDHGLSRFATKSRDSLRGGRMRSHSLAAEPDVPPTVPERGQARKREDEMATAAVANPVKDELRVACRVPLPVRPGDLEELQILGLASYSDDDDDICEEAGKEGDEQVWQTQVVRRPTSMMPLSVLSHEALPTSTLTAWQLETHCLSISRQRRCSMPSPAPTLHTSPDQRKAATVPGPLRMEAQAATLPQEKEASQRIRVVASAGGQAGAQGQDGPVGALESGQLVQKPEAEDDDDMVEGLEEAQILTSSRISISGSCSPTTSANGKPLQINTNLPAWSSSMHSPRMIEVNSSRSPGVETGGSLSRSNSTRTKTPPVGHDRPSPSSLSGPKSSVLHPTRPGSGLAATESISEAEETVELPAQRRASSDAAEVRASRPTLATGAAGAALRGQSTSKTANLAVNTRLAAVNGQTQPAAAGNAGPTPMFDAATTPAVPVRSPERQTFRTTVPATQEAPASSIGRVSVSRVQRSESPATSLERHRVGPAAVRPILHGLCSSTPSMGSRLKPVRPVQDSDAFKPVRDFEELMHSDRTIQYTLTPESMRGAIKDSENRGPLSSFKSSMTQMADRRRSTSLSRSRALTSHPVHVGESWPRGSYGSRGPSSSRTAQPPQPVATKIRSGGLLARDARLPKESVYELAEFLRTTGPNGPVTSPVPSAVHSRGSSVGSSGLLGAYSRALMSSGHLRLQARDAALDYRDDHSHLVDFIRRGPSAAAGNQRIPRTVAPFRTAFNPDQMSAMAGGKAIDAQLRDPDVRSSRATDCSTSIQSSSSQSALLGRNQVLTSGHSICEDGMPKPKSKPKSRRVRDPYAIGLSDEDELQEEESRPEQESLADFLKNAPPPSPDPVVPQPFALGGHVSRQNQAKRKASAPSLMARLARRGNELVGSGSSRSPGPNAKIPGALSGKSSPQSRADISAGPPHNGPKGYIPITINLPTSTSTSIMDVPLVPSMSAPSDKAATILRNGSSRSAGRAPTNNKYNTCEPMPALPRLSSSLVDFLPESELPPEFSRAPLASPPSEELGAFSRVFARRKKSTMS